MKFYILILILFLSVSTFVYAKNSNDYFICVKQNGESDFIVPGFTKRKDCKNKEFKIDLPRELKVFDSNNVELGKLVSYDYLEEPNYLVFNDDLGLIVRYGNNFIGETLPENIYFDGPDCSGRAFLHKDISFPNILYFAGDYYSYDKTIDFSAKIMSVYSRGQCGSNYYSHQFSVDPSYVLLKKVDIYKPVFPLFIKSI